MEAMPNARVPILCGATVSDTPKVSSEGDVQYDLGRNACLTQAFLVYYSIVPERIELHDLEERRWQSCKGWSEQRRDAEVIWRCSI